MVSYFSRMRSRPCSLAYYLASGKGIVFGFDFFWSKRTH